MTHWLREYGVIAAVIIVAMAGYVYYANNKEDVLAYTLDVIGERLIAMVDDDGAKDAVSQRFADIRNRILDKQVDPADVELLAANVLNLSASGKTLTSDEAKLVLDLESLTADPLFGSDRSTLGVEPTTPPSAPSAPRKPAPKKAAPEPNDERFNDLGKRLEAILRTETEIWAMAEEAAIASSSDPFMVFTANDGLHVTVDSMVLAGPDRNKRLAKLKEMERTKAVVLKRDVMKDQKTAREKAWADMEKLREHELLLTESRRDYVKALRVLKGLEAKGVNSFVNMDSIRVVVADEIREAERAIEAGRAETRSSTGVNVSTEESVATGRAKTKQ